MPATSIRAATEMLDLDREALHLRLGGLMTEINQLAGRVAALRQQPETAHTINMLTERSRALVAAT